MNADELQRMAANNSTASSSSSSNGGGGSSPSRASAGSSSSSGMVMLGGGHAESPDDDLKTPTVEELSFPGAKAVSGADVELKSQQKIGFPWSIFLLDDFYNCVAVQLHFWYYDEIYIPFYGLFFYLWAYELICNLVSL